jgi:oligoribonuclease
MTANPNNLIWIDMEMTGLDPEKERIIEIATIVTDSHLNLVAEGPVFAVHQSPELLDNMDSWNTRQHNSSGLVQRVRESTVTEAQAEAETLAFLKKYVPAGRSPLCGNSIYQDRRFLYKYMPELEKYFHYRLIDVSTLKELAQRWAPRVYAGLQKDSKHLALSDIRDSIEELKYYREHFINPEVIR